MILLLLICFNFYLINVSATSYVQPEQVHLSYGRYPEQMLVTWVTQEPTDISIVEYGRNTRKLNQLRTGNMTKFVDGGTMSHVLWIHRVLLDDLIPGTDYVYHCGSVSAWSALYWFTAKQNGTDWSPRLVVYGDLGNLNAQSLPRLQEEIQKGLYDAVFHVGDMAYDLHSENARVGDEFMRQIEAIAAYVPYQVCVGNHEQSYNFSNYVNRFSMMNQEGTLNNHFYSMDIGSAHIIAFSTEFYFFVQYGWIQIANQYKWLEKDLKKANLPENRSQRPWIITMAHRPMYCSTNYTTDCHSNESIIRKGLPVINAFGLEDLFYKYGVDLQIWAHEHFYERMWPLYDKKVYNGSHFAPYTNPRAPVHITTGSAGCRERLDPFTNHPPEWSAARFSDYGYTRLNIINKTHLRTEQVSDDQEGRILDQMLLIKERHGPEAWL